MIKKTQEHEKCRNTKRKIEKKRKTVDHSKTKENKRHIVYIFLETLYFEETEYLLITLQVHVNLFSYP